MTINTTTGALRLTKTEQTLLAKAKALLLKIDKHGDGQLSADATSAADHIADVLSELNKVEEPKAA